MGRKRKLALNTITSIAHQIITLICGFILPRLLLTQYGSAVNGLVSSITQFLGFISFAEMGIGAVVQSTLYKPLAEKNSVEISKIIKSAKNFYNKIMIIFIIYSLVLAGCFNYITDLRFDLLYTGSLVVIIAISMFAQFFGGLLYSILLNADQHGFIQLGIHSVALIINTIITVVLVNLNASIHLVKLGSAIVFVIQPMILAIYVNKHYQIDRKIKLSEEPIKQKWNGLAQHIASVVLNNTDTVVLTIFSTLENVSIYAVYHLVVNGMKQVVNALTNGFDSLFGNILAKNETKLLNESLDLYEWMVHTLVILLFTITAIMIEPFVKVYTLGVSDTNYLQPLFAYLITAAQASYCLRLPYNTIVLAAGHYKQTQTSAIIEAVLNIVISIILVSMWGLIGVAIGTLVAMIYRTVYLVHYLKENILKRPVKKFYKHILVDGIQIVIMVLVTRWINFNTMNYFEWLLEAVIVGSICGIVVILINLVFYRQLMKKVFWQFKNKMLKKYYKNIARTSVISRIIKKIHNCIIVSRLKFKYPGRLIVNGEVFAGKGLELTISSDGKMIIDSLRMENNVMLASAGLGEMTIGDNVFFNQNCCVVCRGKISIGNNCLFGPNVMIYDHNHVFSKDSGVAANDYKTGEIEIGDNCWIGAGVIILKDANIGEGSVIGAGCVIKGRVPPHSVVTPDINVKVKDIYD